MHMPIKDKKQPLIELGGHDKNN